MPMYKSNASKFSKCELRYSLQNKQEPQDIAMHKAYLKALYNAYALLLMDSIIQWTIPTWQC